MTNAGWKRLLEPAIFELRLLRIPSGPLHPALWAGFSFYFVLFFETCKKEIYYV